MHQKAFDRVLGASPNEGFLDLWRRRAVVLVGLSYAVLTLITAGTAIITMGWSPWDALIPVTIGLYLLGPYLLTRGRTVALAGYLVVVTATVSNAAYISVSDGVAGTEMFLFIGGPLAASLLLGLRGVVFAFCLSMVFILSFFFLDPTTDQSAAGYAGLAITTLSLAVVGLFSYAVAGLSRGMIREVEASRAEAVEANKAKSDFLANVSHEIRTPLNGVLAMAESLSTDQLNESAHDKLSVIQESGALLLRVINDVLDVSKIEAGAVSLEQRAFDLGHVAAVASDLYRIQAEAKGLDFGVTISSDVETRRVGDEHRVLQILGNLIGNAVKFTSEGFVHVDVCEGPGGVRILVADSGLGMTSEQAEAVLKPFVQAETSTSRNFGGTGLGLSIVYGLVHAMDGTLALDTSPGVGTTFQIDLPLAPAKNDGSLAEITHTDGPKQAPIYDDQRILIVDDNAVNIQVLQALLAPTRAKLVTATSGEEAIELTTVDAFDVVLMDISMPGVDGIEAADRIWSTCPLNAETPIVAATAHALAHETAMFKRYGFRETLGKPISADRLYTTIDRCLKNGKRSEPLPEKREA